MPEKTLHINMTPRDLLFCRDARPMEGTWNGIGGFLPTPSTLFGAVMAEYCRRYPEKLTAKKSEKDSLRTTGPFLKKDGTVYFTTPLDVAPDNALFTLEKLKGNSDLPSILEYAVFAKKADKKTASPYISCDDFKKYLSGENYGTTAEGDFFDRESRPGITIDPRTRIAKDSQFYNAQYLRLKNGVSLAGDATMDCDNQLKDLFTEKQRTMQLGGQQSLVYVAPAIDKKIQLPQVEITGDLIKYVLLTPAAYLNGWYPDFVNTEGKIVLRAEKGPRPERKPGESRTEYRKRIFENSIQINAKLIAARVGKPLAISGWKMKNEGGGSPRATHLYVPAGSVYYFKAENVEHARLLAETLQGKSYSAYGACAGHGIGVCGNFTINQ